MSTPPTEECTTTDALDVCTAVDAYVTLTHLSSLNHEEVIFHFLKYSEEITSALSLKFKTTYVGERALIATTVITLQGVPEREMEESEQEYFSRVVKDFLNSSVLQNKVKILTVSVVEQQHAQMIDEESDFQNRFRTRKRGLSSLFLFGGFSRSLESSSSAISITTTVTGMHRPPPHLDFGVLVEDSFYGRSEEFTEELKKKQAKEEILGNDNMAAYYFEKVWYLEADTISTPSPTPSPVVVAHAKGTGTAMGTGTAISVIIGAVITAIAAVVGCWYFFVLRKKNKNVLHIEDAQVKELSNARYISQIDEDGNIMKNKRLPNGKFKSNLSKLVPNKSLEKTDQVENKADLSRAQPQNILKYTNDPDRLKRTDHMEPIPSLSLEDIGGDQVGPLPLMRDSINQLGSNRSLTLGDLLDDQIGPLLPRRGSTKPYHQSMRNQQIGMLEDEDLQHLRNTKSCSNLVFKTRSFAQQQSLEEYTERVRRESHADMDSSCLSGIRGLVQSEQEYLKRANSPYEDYISDDYESDQSDRSGRIENEGKTGRQDNRNSFQKMKSRRELELSGHAEAFTEEEYLSRVLPGRAQNVKEETEELIHTSLSRQSSGNSNLSKEEYIERMRMTTSQGQANEMGNPRSLRSKSLVQLPHLPKRRVDRTSSVPELRMRSQSPHGISPKEPRITSGFHGGFVPQGRNRGRSTSSDRIPRPTSQSASCGISPEEPRMASGFHGEFVPRGLNRGRSISRSASQGMIIASLDNEGRSDSLLPRQKKRLGKVARNNNHHRTSMSPRNDRNKVGNSGNAVQNHRDMRSMSNMVNRDFSDEIVRGNDYSVMATSEQSGEILPYAQINTSTRSRITDSTVSCSLSDSVPEMHHDDCGT